MRLFITSTSIGGPVELLVPKGETLEGLRTRLSRQLQMQTDQIALLHEDKQLTAGSLMEQGVADGSRLTLQVPGVVETDLFCSRARAARMVEVLESLTECQITDFLSGRSPLTLKLAMGANAMFLQLQLSAQDVAKLQLNEPSEAPNRPETCSRTDTSSTCPAAYCMQSQPQTVVSAVTCNRRPSSHHPLPHTIVPTPPTCPLPASTPVSFTNPSSAAPQSPLPASTFTESAHSSSGQPVKQAGAVIESFVGHSQGVFSGTFSGLLAPCSRSGLSHPRRGIAIIMQILDDLFRAASRYQTAQENPFCHASDPLLHDHKDKAKHLAETTDEETHRFLATSEENQTMHCKLKRLQFLMDQQRHHKRTRRSSKLSQTSHPYRHRHHR
ncbi:midnolin-B-like [Nerophis lumbriciformis]|uniref:midnolin-B-like n=1 Tax=Nerophis lumbriciformis TaxID=546530 RepID=UPI002ADFF2EF|nr:midnolin-like [Nerophis lumbriciformis]